MIELTLDQIITLSGEWTDTGQQAVPGYCRRQTNHNRQNRRQRDGSRGYKCSGRTGNIRVSLR